MKDIDDLYSSKRWKRKICLSYFIWVKIEPKLFKIHRISFLYKFTLQGSCKNIYRWLKKHMSQLMWPIQFICHLLFAVKIRIRFKYCYILVYIIQMTWHAFKTQLWLVLNLIQWNEIVLGLLYKVHSTETFNAILCMVD